MLRSSLHTPPARHGSPKSKAGRSLVLVSFALALAFGLGYLLLSEPKAVTPTPGGATPDLAGAETEVPAQEPAAPLRDSSARTAEPTPPEPNGVSAQRASSLDPPTGDRGRLRGELLIRAGDRAGPPESWTLVIEPSRIYRGTGAAITRRVLIKGTDLMFDERDLPFGGYDLYAQAPGWNSRRQSVQLSERANSAYVLLELIPAGTLSGSIQDTEGLPFEGLSIFLEPVNSETNQRRTESSLDGTFSFPKLPDGSYRLLLGSATNPMVEPTSIAFKAPGFGLEPIQLPRLGGVVLRVLDPFGVAVPRAQITGYGDQGGEIDLLTDAFGEVRTVGLLPGRWTFRSQVENIGAAVLSVQVYKHGQDPDAETNQGSGQLPVWTMDLQAEREPR